MSIVQNSAIAWTDHTFNPWWSCTKVDACCSHCYAETLAKRWGFSWGPKAPRRLFGPKHWAEPLAWNAKAAKSGKTVRVFCGSMCDWAEDRRDLDDERVKLWKLIEATPALTWLLLTKRSQNIRSMLPTIQIGGEELPRFNNVWVGVTVGIRANLSRLDDLRAVPAVVRFVSFEPLLEDLGLIDLTGISWGIVGCESGPKARPMREEWVKNIFGAFAAPLRPMAFFYKQAMTAGRLDHEPMIYGQTWHEFPMPPAEGAR